MFLEIEYGRRSLLHTLNKRKIHTNVEMERQTERAQIKAGERGLKLKKSGGHERLKWRERDGGNRKSWRKV